MSDIFSNVSLDEWTPVGEGYNGTAYASELHPGILLKMVRGDLGSAEKVAAEFRASKLAGDMGLPTPKMYEIVRAGNDYGYTSEIIVGKKSLARLCADDPAQIPAYAALMVKHGKAFHETPVPAGVSLRSIKSLLSAALPTSKVVPDEWLAFLLDFVERMPEPGTCLHGDFQLGNLIIAEGKPYWIDLGWFSQGDPLMDIGHLYMMLVENSFIPTVQELTHMSREQMLSFWDCFAREYSSAQTIIMEATSPN